MVSFSLSFFLIAKNARCNWRNKLAWLMHLSFSLRDIVHQQHSRKMCTLFCKKNHAWSLNISGGRLGEVAWIHCIFGIKIPNMQWNHACNCHTLLLCKISVSHALCRGTFIAPCSVPKLLGSTSYLHACTIWVTLYGSCTNWMCTRPMSQGRNQFF